MHTLYKKLIAPVIFVLSLSLSSLAFGQASSDQADMLGLGIGFGGGMGAPGISYNLLPGYSGTNTPNFSLSYERKFSRTFSLGLVADYSGAMYTGNNIPYNIADPNTSQSYTGTVSDKLSGNYFALGARIAYHIKAGDSFDPYVGAILGITLASAIHTITDTTSTFTSHQTYAGILLGACVGARYYISDSFGIWLEVDYAGIPSYLGNIGITYQISHF